jgi:hypothetical protein
MTNEEIKKLKDAGIDDATINSIAQEDAAKQVPSNAQTQGPVEPVLPDIDVTQPSETLKNAQAMGVPTANEGSYMTDAMALGSAAAPYIVPVTAGALGLYGATKVGGWGREIGKGVQSMAEAQRAGAAAQQATAQGLQDRFNQRMAQQGAQQAIRPVVPGPGSMAGVTPTTAMGPVSPVVPQGMPAPTPAPASSLIDKTTGMIRQLAANKVVQGLAKGANVLGGVQMATYSPELGPKTPQVGRMRGMEINPLTGRPWTPEQINQYEANPNMFDSQMAQPQMRR